MNHFWQSYVCKCVSPMLTDETKLPMSCPKHAQPFLQRYISNKVRGSIGQIEDNEQPAIGIEQKHINE